MLSFVVPPLSSLSCLCRLIYYSHLYCSDRGVQVELQDGGAARADHERGSRKGRVVELDGDFVFRGDEFGVFGSGGGGLMNVLFFEEENR